MMLLLNEVANHTDCYVATREQCERDRGIRVAAVHYHDDVDWVPAQQQPPDKVTSLTASLLLQPSEEAPGLDADFASTAVTHSPRLSA